jgi:hypothetical protein
MNFFAYKNLHCYKIICFTILAISLWSCNKDETYVNLPAYGPAQVFYALTDQNKIVTYDAKDVRSSIATAILNGLATNEVMMDIDFRPATGELYGISNQNKLYIIDTTTGTATAVSTTIFSPIINGTTLSIDFDPTTDRIRLVSNTGQNLRINPETATIEGTDASISNTSISGIAYNSSFSGTTSTTLYAIDANANTLNKQSGGTLTKVGDLAVVIGSNSCFDISPNNTKVFGVGKNSEGTRLYTIDLTSGKATLAGKFSTGTTIISIAIPASPVAYAVSQSNNLFIFDPTLTTATVYTKALTGLQTGETIYGIDIRPLNGVLYALGSSNRLYTINFATGAAMQVGLLSTALNGTSFGFDFNPITDQIRIVSNTGQNLRVNPNTAAVTTDVNITTPTATISAAAYSYNFRLASSTALYVVDHTVDKLYRQEPNTGVLTEVGALTVNVAAANGFDIVYAGADFAFGIFTVGSKNICYNIDLSTGAATPVFEFPYAVTGFALGLKM